MKLVKFADGKFGVRRYWLFGWHFQDLKHPQFTWTGDSEWIIDCKGSREKAERVMATIKAPAPPRSDVHTVVRDSE